MVSCAAAGDSRTTWYVCPFCVPFVSILHPFCIPFASLLAFVWDISAWLTSKFWVRGGCLCPGWVTELLRMEETRGRSSGETICCWDNSSLLYTLQLRLFWQHTHSQTETQTNGQTRLVLSVLSPGVTGEQQHSFINLGFTGWLASRQIPGYKYPNVSEIDCFISEWQSPTADGGMITFLMTFTKTTQWMLPHYAMACGGCAHCRGILE